MAGMNPDEFHYELPAELIAQTPLPSRTDSRLLCVDRSGQYTDARFSDLSDHVDSGDLLVLNDTRVIPARLFGRKSTGGKVELLLERQLGDDLALVQLKSSRSPAVGGRLGFDCGAEATVEERREDFFVLRFTGPLAEIFDQHGHMPLPPYIKRADDVGDVERYQTVYARHPGAVAAPTAGLHFDRAQLNRLRSRGVDVGYLTLHVGAGTFQPLRQAQLESGKLHSERMVVPESLCTKILETRARGGKVVAVGTTTVRGLETAALRSDDESGLRPFDGDTDLLITPGFDFRVVDAMLTNFHLPGSSLLMLVGAFAGTGAVMGAYAHAVESGYRFYSYGDAMFCYRAPAAQEERG
jgi:S-adenosylmethionine:tRNA ribosyltransferase-isomerase